ncbi:MAG TPA: toxin-antitoxin system HicB family antitoxin [Planctomycetaceae bacterium]|nr:toxin-antitoxin system HicB family antitoxin [Planctomycetaceae bacterium]
MTFTEKAGRIVEQAKALASTVTTWADFAAAVFGHKDGLIAKTFTDEAERQLFYDSEEYRTLSSMRLQLIKKFGVQEGATPEKSGRVLLRIPKSLHKSLEVEAKREGVSLNQLAVSKLSLPLKERVDLSIALIAEPAEDAPTGANEA